MLNLPKNIYVISLVMALGFSVTSMMVLVAGLAGAQIADNPQLATLPLAMMVVGTAIGTIPAALIMQKIGRKKGVTLGIFVAIAGLGLSYLAVIQQSFSLFLLSSIMIGLNAAFTQQGRFIIMENANGEKQIADGLTLGLLANLIAAILGPAIGSYGRDFFSSSADYAGSFVFSAAILVIAMLVLTQFKNLPMPSRQLSQTKPALWPIIRQPIFLLAAGSSAIGFGVMSFVMTATPISMHEMSGHSLEHTRFVIQSHIIAMFLPSFLSGYLLKRGFSRSLIVTGLVLYLFVALIALYDRDVLHYWWALVLLGLGWNLIFITSTSLLPKAYNEDNKFKAQAANDFSVFTFQAIASFAAGWVLFNLQWSGVIYVALAVTIFWLLMINLLKEK